MTTYQEMLRDPRWAEKSREIMYRDEHTCRRCGASNVRLNVHHTFYHELFKSPWGYPNSSLITLCEDCHKKEHDCSFNEKAKVLYSEVAANGYFGEELETLIKLFWLARLLESGTSKINEALFWTIVRGRNVDLNRAKVCDTYFEILDHFGYSPEDI